tara:strand:- start:14343 stop:15452 length:1110 start_codon:yes stop_codon:yes gene_type:complete
MQITYPYHSDLKNYLCPPGCGVFTVNTAGNRKQVLHQAIYGQTEAIDALWQETLQQLEQAKVVMLGVCSDNGGGILRGANWGPLFLRLQLLQEVDVSRYLDIGDIRVIPHLLHDKYLNEDTIRRCQKALFDQVEQGLAVSPLSITEAVCQRLYECDPDKKIFAIGGDHSVSYPLVRTFLQHKKAQGIQTAVIHFDAHTDLLTERLGIDLCFGSWCTHILNDLPHPSHLIQLGIRASGQQQSFWERKFGVTQYWAHTIAQKGAEYVAQEICAALHKAGVQELYVSFDIDALDQSIASATGTPEPDGLDVNSCILILETLVKNFTITGADVVEIAPFTDSLEQGTVGQAKTLQAGSCITKTLLKALNMTDK